MMLANNTPEGWRWVTVDEIKLPEKGSLVSGPFGSNIGKKFFVDAGVPVIRGNNLTLGTASGRFVDGDYVFVSETKANELQHSSALPGDIVFTARGTIGQVGLIPIMADYKRYILSANQLRLRCDTSIAYPLFIYYWFSSSYMVNLMAGYNVGTALPNMNLGALRRLPVLLPPLPEQRAIAAILGALDDKIELNRQMNETLEAMTRALFKSWFVDFEPFRDQGMEDSPLGPIPGGWRVGKVNEIAELSKESINPGDYPNETFNHYSIPAFDEGWMPKIERGDQIKSNKFQVPNKAVLISKLNPRFPRVWLPSISNSKNSVCSTEFLVVLPRENVTREYLYSLFSSHSFLETFLTLVTGTSSSHQRVRPEDSLSIEVIIPPQDVTTAFSEKVHPSHELVTRNLNENKNLATIRDTLLPKLLSGEIRVKDANKFVERAL
jgi:type I restriction enzyme S subunit